MSSEWYYTKDRRTRIGPLSWEELIARAAFGEVAVGDMVWQAGTQRWLAAASVPHLFPELPEATVPAPPAPPILTPAENPGDHGDLALDQFDLDGSGSGDADGRFAEDVFDDLDGLDGFDELGDLGNLDENEEECECPCDCDSSAECEDCYRCHDCCDCELHRCEVCDKVEDDQAGSCPLLEECDCWECDGPCGRRIPDAHPRCEYCEVCRQCCEGGHDDEDEDGWGEDWDEEDDD